MNGGTDFPRRRWLAMAHRGAGRFRVRFRLTGFSKGDPLGVNEMLCRPRLAVSRRPAQITNVGSQTSDRSNRAPVNDELGTMNCGCTIRRQICDEIGDLLWLRRSPDRYSAQAV